MSEWWDRYLFDDLIGLEAAAVTSDGSRHIGPFVRFGDYLTVDDTCVFTRKDKGDGVRLMEEVDHVRLRPEEPFWQGRFLDELEGVRVRVEFELFQLVRECIQFDCRYTAGYACTVV